MMYCSLLADGQFTAVLVMHRGLQQVLAPQYAAVAAQDQQAYDALWTPEVLARCYADLSARYAQPSLDGTALAALAEALVQYPFDSAVVGETWYRPWLQAGRYREICGLHQALQQALGNQEAARAAEHRDFAALWTHDVMNPYYAALAARCVALSPQDAAGMTRVAEDIALLPLAGDLLGDILYRPLLAAGQGALAEALHAQLQCALRPAGLEAVQAADQVYTTLFTRDFIEKLCAQLQQSLQAGDLAGARITLEQINILIPEYPQAIEARQQYRKALAAQTQE